MMLQESHLVVFDPPGKGAGSCFSAEMSTHLLGKASELLLVFPKPVPPGWLQMWRREGNGSSLDWWEMRQSGEGLGKEGKNSSGKQSLFCFLSWIFCCLRALCHFSLSCLLLLFSLKGQLGSKQHETKTFVSKLVQNPAPHYFPFYFLGGCVQSDLTVEKQGKQLQGRHQHIHNPESLSLVTFFTLSSGLKKYKSVLSEVAASFTWPELSSDVRSGCCGHLKSVITQRLCLLQCNSQVL